MVLILKTALTKEIEKRLYFYDGYKLGRYGCFECCLGKGYGNEYVDYMTMNTNQIFRCYEIKVSMSDLKSQCKLSFVGDYNYLVIPIELYNEILCSDKELCDISPQCNKDVGILVYDRGQIVSKKKAKRNCKPIDRNKLMQYMIRSLSRLTGKEWK